MDEQMLSKECLNVANQIVSIMSEYKVQLHVYKTVPGIKIVISLLRGNNLNHEVVKAECIVYNHRSTTIHMESNDTQLKQTYTVSRRSNVPTATVVSNVGRLLESQLQVISGLDSIVKEVQNKKHVKLVRKLNRALMYDTSITDYELASIRGVIVLRINDTRIDIYTDSGDVNISTGKAAKLDMGGADIVSKIREICAKNL